jgi:hypothetical protein
MRVPPTLATALKLYVQHGYHPGGFLDAVLSSKIFIAYDLGDEEARKAIPAIVAAIKKFPSNCYGSAERVQQWCHNHGIDGGADSKVQ